MDFAATDAPSGVLMLTAMIDGTVPVTDGQVLDLADLAPGEHTLVVTAVDWYGNEATASVTFSLTVTLDSLVASVQHYLETGAISGEGIANSLLSKLDTAMARFVEGKTVPAMNALRAFINEVQAQTGKAITPEAAARRQVSPPGGQPLPGQEQRVRRAVAEQRVPLGPKLLECRRVVESRDHGRTDRPRMRSHASHQTIAGRERSAPSR